MNYSLQLFVFFIWFLLLFYIIFINRTKSKTSAREAPELGGAWPIIGHLHLLAGDNHLLYRTLGAMADKYGPAFNIRLGTRRAFVVSSWEVAKDCFTVNDKALASRPKTTAMKHMGYNYAVFGFAPYSPFLSAVRKISTLELLSHRPLEMRKDIRLSEINSGIKELYGRWEENSHRRPVVVEMNKWLEHMMLNIIVMMVVGKRFSSGGREEAERCQKLINDFFRMIGIFVVSDAIPFLWWLDLRYVRQMKKTNKDLDVLLGGWLDEHREKRRLDLERKNEDVKDFMDVMLSLEEEGKLSGFQYDPDTCIKSTCLALILGGSDTIAGTLTWAISLLLNHPDALTKLQHEIDEHVGKERQVEESDIKNLVFLQAVIKETLRLYPAGPLLGPREAMEDCTVAGYNVKAGTRLIVNIWKLQRDTSVWTNPSKFEPERFMGPDHGHVDLKGQQFVLMPFGFGRRSCIGSTFGLQVIHMTLARLVHSFDLDRLGGLPIDMTESPGLTIPKKKPLEVLLNPRLQAKLYGCC